MGRFKYESEKYDETLSTYPDVRKVLDDPGWQRVREAAGRFVDAFEQKHPETSVTAQH